MPGRPPSARHIEQTSHFLGQMFGGTLLRHRDGQPLAGLHSSKRAQLSARRMPKAVVDRRFCDIHGYHSGCRRTDDPQPRTVERTSLYDGAVSAWLRTNLTMLHFDDNDRSVVVDRWRTGPLAPSARRSRAPVAGVRSHHRAVPSAPRPPKRRSVVGIVIHKDGHRGLTRDVRQPAQPGALRFCVHRGVRCGRRQPRTRSRHHMKIPQHRLSPARAIRAGHESPAGFGPGQLPRPVAEPPEPETGRIPQRRVRRLSAGAQRYPHRPRRAVVWPPRLPSRHRLPRCGARPVIAAREPELTAHSIVGVGAGRRHDSTRLRDSHRSGRRHRD